MATKTTKFEKKKIVLETTETKKNVTSFCLINS